jgi:hypothetical protein
MSRDSLSREVDLFGSLDPGFAFPLAMQVQGWNARNQEFAEDTFLSSISHRGSSFYLRNPVHIGTRLRLVIDLPEKLSEDLGLKLVVKGRVARVEARRESPAIQKITVEFDSKYIIKPNG